MKKILFILFVFLINSCDSILLNEEEPFFVSYEKNMSIPEQLNDGLQTASPESVNINLIKIKDYVKNIYQNKPNDALRSLLIVRHRKLVFEGYFNGWHRERRQDLRSATKSIMSALIGIGIDKEFLSNEHEKVLDYFGEYESLENWDDRKSDMTIQNFLRMRTGLACNDRVASSPGNEKKVYESADWIKFMLDLPMASDPGSSFSYCSASPITLGVLLSKASQKSVQDFSDIYLFSQLGIDNYEWKQTPFMRNVHLRPRDMLKFGLLFLNEGTWNGQRIISENWIKKSTEPTAFAEGYQYGYLWWTTTWNIDGSETSAYFAWGNGGQQIFVLPKLDMVVVITAGRYNKSIPGFRLMENVILPSIQH